MPFKYNIDMASDSICTVELSGNIDPDAYSELKESMDEIIERSPHAVIFNMEHLKYIDSTGLAAILNVRKNLEGKGGVLVLAALQKRIKDVINVTRIVQDECIFDTYEDACKGIKALI